MKNLWRIARWEFSIRLRSRSFYFNTFISPLLFTVLLTLPIFIFRYEPDIPTRLIGVIDLSGKNMSNSLQTDLNQFYRLKNQNPEYMVLNVSLNNNPYFSQLQAEYEDIRKTRDSIATLFEEIRRERTNYYQRTTIPNREFLMQTSYEKLQSTREEKELIEVELERFRANMDSVYGTEARQTADSLLTARVLDAYLVFPPGFVNSGDMEYHSHKSAAFLETTRLEKILQNIIIDRRMANDNVERLKIRRWLKPITIRRYQLEAGTTREWNFYAQFYGPLISVFLLFIAIFTSGGYLFSSVLLEKSNKILEQLLSSTPSGILLAGKFIGFGSLGLVQIMIWLIVLFIIQYSGFLPADQVSYLTLDNLGLFILYFILGYLLFGAFFILLGTISPTVYDAQQYNQSLRTIAILPALLSLLVFTNPESRLISFLSYIPPLSPSFMIMRIPLSPQSLLFDILVTIGLLLVTGAVVMLLAASSFRNLVLLQGRKPTLGEWWNAVKFF